MTLSPTKRRAERLADLLETGTRTDDPDLSPMVALASALGDVAQPAAPRAEFRDALRQRLLAVATVQGVGESATAGQRLRETTTTWRFQRRVASIAAGAATVTAVAGVGVGASRSLPGDAFYGLKRGTENVQLALTSGQEAKGKRHLEFARTRLAEVRALSGESAALPLMTTNGHWTAAGAPHADPSTILATLHDMDAETRAGAHDLYAAYRSSGSAEPLQALNAFTQAQYAGLLDLLPRLPQGARPAAKSSLSLLTIVRATTVQIAQPQHPARPGGHHPRNGTTSSSHSTATPHTTSPPAPGTGSTTTPASGSTSPSATKSDPTVTTVPTIPVLPTSVPVPTTIPTLVPVPNLSGAPLLGP
jgi:hypothetical protein